MRGDKFWFLITVLLTGFAVLPLIPVYAAMGWEWWPVARLFLAALFLFNIELNLK